jgi:hypothetical protein
VPAFPDPNSQGAFAINGPLNTPPFQLATSRCSTLRHPAWHPPRPAPHERASLLEYSCVRSPAITDFADPSTGMGGAVRLALSAGRRISVSVAIFRRAQRTCGRLQPAAEAGSQ